MAKKNEWTQIGVRIKKSLLKQLEKAAFESGHTVASYLRTAALEKAQLDEAKGD